MSVLAAKRCFHHARREAAARCPACGRFYCRECITEHDDRVICATCLRQLSEGPGTTGRSWQTLIGISRLAVGILALWLLFYLVGRGLLLLPDAFHKGTIWSGY